MATYKKGVHVDDGDGGERLLHGGFGDVGIQKRGERAIYQTLSPTGVAFVHLSQFGADGSNSEIRFVV